MGTFLEEATFLFSFCLPSYQEADIRENHLLPYELIVSFWSGPYFERTALSRKANRKSQKLFPFVKMIEIHAGILTRLR